MKQKILKGYVVVMLVVTLVIVYVKCSEISEL